MFHSGTAQLLDYWRMRRGDEDAPSRADIDPADLIDLLPKVFMLGREGPGRYSVRLAGGFIAKVHGRELRGADALKLWDPAARTPLQLALEAIRRHPEPLVIDAEARAGEIGARFEILVAPLRGPSGQIDRLLGLYDPASPEMDLKGAVISPLQIRGIVSTAPTNDAFPRLRLAAIDGRQTA
jgi:hypothetical protein